MYHDKFYVVCSKATFLFLMFENASIHVCIIVIDMHLLLFKYLI